MAKSRWFPHLRLLAGGLRSLGRIATALERIADVQDGIEHPRDTTPLPAPTRAEVVIAQRLPDADLARLDDLRTQYIHDKGYDPSPEELEALFDQREYGPDDLRPSDRERLGL